jgi:hypothetical protein
MTMRQLLTSGLIKTLGATGLIPGHNTRIQAMQLIGECHQKNNYRWITAQFALVLLGFFLPRCLPNRNNPMISKADFNAQLASRENMSVRLTYCENQCSAAAGVG